MEKFKGRWTDRWELLAWDHSHSRTADKNDEMTLPTDDSLWSHKVDDRRILKGSRLLEFASLGFESSETSDLHGVETAFLTATENSAKSEMSHQMYRISIYTINM